MKTLMFYIPRVLSILVILVLAPFVLEGLGPDFSWVDSLMHGLIVLIAIIATVIAWKWPKVGGFIFILFGLLFLTVVVRGEVFSGLIFGGILTLAGILFLIEGFKKNT